MKRNENVDPNEVKYRHLRTVAVNTKTGDVINCYNLGGATVAYRELDAETIIYAVAICSEKDNYCKKTGRTIATGRLKSPKHAVTVKASFSEFHKMVSDISEPIEALKAYGLNI